MQAGILTSIMRHTLESSPLFPYVAWSLVLIGVGFVLLLVVRLNTIANQLVATEGTPTTAIRSQLR